MKSRIRMGVVAAVLAVAVACESEGGAGGSLAEGGLRGSSGGDGAVDGEALCGSFVARAESCGYLEEDTTVEAAAGECVASRDEAMEEDPGYVADEDCVMDCWLRAESCDRFASLIAVECDCENECGAAIHGCGGGTGSTGGGGGGCDCSYVQSHCTITYDSFGNPTEHCTCSPSCCC